jgi:hypothetical protein
MVKRPNKYVLGLVLGKKSSPSESAVSWAVLPIKRVDKDREIVAAGEEPMPMGNDLHAKARAVLDFFLRQRAEMNVDPKDMTVRFDRYSPLTFGQSRAAREGMSFEDHTRLLEITTVHFLSRGIKATFRDITS